MRLSNNKNQPFARLSNFLFSKSKASVFVWVTVFALSITGVSFLTGDGFVGEVDFLAGKTSIDQDEFGGQSALTLNESGYDYGTFPTDTTDYDSYYIPPASEELNAKLLTSVNDSIAYDHLDSIFELLDYDDFDKNGNIKEDVMLDLIDISESNR